MLIKQLREKLDRKQNELLYDYVIKIYNLPNIDGMTNTMKMEAISDAAYNDKNENEGDE